MKETTDNSFAWNGAAFLRVNVPDFGEVIRELAEQATVSCHAVGESEVVLCEWDREVVRATRDLRWDRNLQIGGMKGWISRFPAELRNANRVAELVHMLDSTKECIGCVGSATTREAVNLRGLLCNLARWGRGFIFAHQSFYGSEGERIIGLPGDPAELSFHAPQLPGQDGAATG